MPAPPPTTAPFAAPSFPPRIPPMTAPAPAPMPIFVASSPLVAAARCDERRRLHVVLIVPCTEGREAKRDQCPSFDAARIVNFGHDAGQPRAGRQHVTAVNRDRPRELSGDRILDGARVGRDRARQGQRQRGAGGNRHMTVDGMGRGAGLRGLRDRWFRRCSRGRAVLGTEWPVSGVRRRSYRTRRRQGRRRASGSVVVSSSCVTFCDSWRGVLLSACASRRTGKPWTTRSRRRWSSATGCEKARGVVGLADSMLGARAGRRLFCCEQHRAANALRFTP